jgi:ADP-ribose pyrophosphatase YjhB (NUDIX family)
VEWWVPGGRVEHGEFAVDAARRKVKADLGIEVLHPRPIGYTNQFFERRHFGEDPYHTISIVFEAEATSLNVRLRSENADWLLAKDVPDKLVQQMTRFV